MKSTSPVSLSLGAVLLGLAALTAGASEEVHRAPFIRGDADADGTLALSDAVRLLGHLFQEGLPLSCVDALDTNADLAVDLSDAISTLSHLFLGGPAPRAPYPECGTLSESESALGCESFAACRGGGPLPAVLDPGLIEAVVPAVPGVSPPRIVSAELFDAFEILASGEPIRALRGIPGWEEWLGSDADLARVVETTPEPEPSVELHAEVEVGASFLRLGDEDLASIGFHLAAAGLLAPGSIIAEVRPAVLDLDPALEAGEAPTLVVEKLADGSLRAWGTRIEWVRGAVQRIEGVFVRRPGHRSLISTNVDPSAIHCQWILRISLEPRKVSRQTSERFWDDDGEILPSDSPVGAEAPVLGDRWSIAHGMGPSYQILVARDGANCSSPETSIPKLAFGSMLGGVSLLCTTLEGFEKVPCGDGAVDLQGVYRSTLTVSTQAGGSCFLYGPNDIEAAALDEAALSAESEVIFQGGAKVHNGNDVTTQIQFGFEAGFGWTAGRGPGGTVGVRAGYSETTQHRTGLDSSVLRLAGSARIPKLPAYFRLDAQGKSYLRAANRTCGYALVDPGAAGFNFVATSTCPEVPPTSWGLLVGGGPALEEAQRDGAFFLELKLGGDSSVHWEDLLSSGKER